MPRGAKQSLKKDRAAVKEATLVSLQKEKFIQALFENNGNVSRALAISGLKRNEAYGHFKTDSTFAGEWLDAQEMAADELFEEARRRAVEGEQSVSVGKDGKEVTTVKKSDTLLAYLLKQGDAQKKWRSRLLRVGNLALESIKAVGEKHGLPEEVITAIQDEMTERFKQIQLN